MGKGFYLFQGVLAGVFFSLSPILIRLLPRLDAFSIGFYRLGLASGIMFLVAFLLRELGRRGLGESLLLGLILGGHFAVFILSVKHTSVMNATVLVNTAPVFAALISWRFLGMRPGARGWLGVTLGVIGVTLLFSERLSLEVGVLGEVEALAGALLWAVYLNVGRRLRLKTHPLRTMPHIYLSSALLLLLLALAAGGLSTPYPREVPVLLGLAVLPTCLGHTLHFSSLRGLKPYQTSALALLEPVLASAQAVPLFGEVPGPQALLGGGLILLSIYLVSSEL